MKIVYLINQYPKVSHTFIRREILALESQGFDVKRVSTRPPESNYIDEEDNLELNKTTSLLQGGAVVLFLEFCKCFFTRTVSFFRTIVLAWNMGKKSERGRIIHLIYVAEACLLLYWIKKWKAVHIHAHFGTNTAAIALFCHMLGGPCYSFTPHGPDEYDKPLSIGLNEKIKHSSFISAISYFTRSQLYRWSDFSDWNKIKIIHCGLDKKFLYSQPTSVPDIKRLVCIGRLCEQKGQLLLVQAASKVILNRTPFELVLVGDGEMRNEIENLIITLGIQPYVKITGWVTSDQVLNELINSRGLVLPSFAEGLPVVIMESFALARPVISTYIAGIPELVFPNINGWLCPASDIDALVQSIEEILSTSAKKLSEMGLNGRELVQKNHNIEQEAKKLGDAIRNCVNN